MDLTFKRESAIFGKFKGFQHTLENNIGKKMKCLDNNDRGENTHHVSLMTTLKRSFKGENWLSQIYCNKIE